MDKIGYIICKTNNCKNKYHAKGYCEKHYRKWRKYSSNRSLCIVTECENNALARNYCETHYKRWYRHGDTDKRSPIRGICSVEECNKPHESKGFCGMHYIRWRTHGDKNINRVRVKICTIQNCNKKHEALDLCQNHYKQKRYRENKLVRIAGCLRTRMSIAIKNARETGSVIQNKAGSAVQDLDCSIEEFITYIEKKFTKGMTWDNHGEWHLDHIIPLVSFDLANREEFLVAVNYKNYQPLWAEDNQKKAGKQE